MRTGLYQHQVGGIVISQATLTIYLVCHPQKQPTIIPSDDKNEDTGSGADKAAEKAAQSLSPEVEVQDINDIRTPNNQKQSTQDIDHFFSGVIMNEGKKSWKC